jgi:endonuclease/exonuclease/phosphatase family metal-dependent hydrolase
MNSLRVATINLWCRRGDWTTRKAVLTDTFAKLRPDLVAVQESVVTDDYDQLEEILGSGYYLYHQEGRAKDGVGASIASRWPLARVHEVSLPRTYRMDDGPGWLGSAAVAELFLPEPLGRILFVHHKPASQPGFEAERELQAVATARFVEAMVEPRAVHVLLAGDFGASPAASSVRFWYGLQALQGTSVCYHACHGDESGQRSDYLMVRCGDHGPTLRVMSCSQILTEPAVNGHFGVTAEVAPA